MSFVSLYNINFFSLIESLSSSYITNSSLALPFWLIDKNETFFLSLPEIKHIVVIGHSLADIDLGYFGKIVSMSNPKAIWHFSYHSKDDRKHVDKFKWQCKNQSLPRIINEGEIINL